MDLLLSHGANVNICDNAGSSPLHAAVGWCNLFDTRYSSLCSDVSVEYARTHSVVQRLLERGAIVNLKDKEGNIPLHLAICNDKRRYIDSQCADIDALLQYKSDVYAPSGFDGLNSLQLAAKNGKNMAVKFCLQYGMNPNQYRTFDQAPVNLAVKENHQEVVRTLLEHGGEIRYFTGEFSVLHTAAFEGLDEMVNFLIDQGADPLQGHALHWIQNLTRIPILGPGHVKAVKTLVTKGATLKVDTNLCTRVEGNYGLLTLHFFIRSQCGHKEHEGKKFNTLFCNPHLQHSFASEIFYHLVQENAIVFTENRDISFPLAPEHLRKFFKITCPAKLNILRLAGFRFMLSFLMRCFNFLVETNKLNDQWERFYFQLRDPLSLKEHCRIAIRRTMPAPLSASTNRLSYPKCLQEYLLMPEIH